ncbi:MAG TPA: alpha-L-arabinofuranosidase C-terminal domain-containing protein [Protaetiibacter sp.]|nr:alpha-L-arabinofuranosidase C-terminal domain-containing protein [Protaetiibacter sp.]
MNRAIVRFSTDFEIGVVAPTLFGSFVEHMGRGVYGGIYDPGPLADASGFRLDVVALIRELGVTAVRYPGGNFVSAYDWEDGVGPLDERPKRLDLAWKTVEPNTVGVVEYLEWCALVGVEPILAFNLGTRGIDAARSLFEYVNGSPGTRWADLRVSHGHPEPFGVRYWCLGNEMDGPWQIGQKPAQEYAGIAREVAKALKLIDPDCVLIACGSSHERMPTFGEWERIVLEESYPYVDYISLHAYYEPDPANPAVYLESAYSMDRFIRGVVATADSVGARLGSTKRIQLAFDEWNIFDPRRFGPAPDAWVPTGSPISEGVFDATDAVVVGDLMVTLLNNCDRVGIAALAQLVNGIAPIMTSPDSAWRQTIFHPFARLSAAAGGTVLRPRIAAPELPSERFEAVPSVSIAAVLLASGEELLVTGANRSLESAVAVEVAVAGFGIASTSSPVVIEARDADGIRPLEASVVEGRLLVELPPASWFAVSLAEDAAGA